MIGISTELTTDLRADSDWFPPRRGGFSTMVPGRNISARNICDCAGRRPSDIPHADVVLCNIGASYGSILLKKQHKSKGHIARIEVSRHRQSVAARQATIVSRGHLHTNQFKARAIRTFWWETRSLGRAAKHDRVLIGGTDNGKREPGCRRTSRSATNVDRLHSRLVGARSAFLL